VPSAKGQYGQASAPAAKRYVRPERMMEYTALSFTDLSVSSYSLASLSDKRSSMPVKYLAFARADLLEGKLDRYRVNAYSNAKRALHCQVDILIRALGAHHNKKIMYSKFPGQIDLLQKCGIVSPAILRRINALRNRLEHEYLIPTLEETETCLDVVELFLAATSKWIRQFPEEVELEDNPDDG
jgi:hypothetical protein